jgi:hypothetical protein
MVIRANVWDNGRFHLPIESMRPNAQGVHFNVVALCDEGIFGSKPKV